MSYTVILILKYMADIINFNSYVEYSENGIISKKIIASPGGNITLFSFDEGQELSEHSAPFSALVQVLDGEAEIIIDRVPYYLKTGESIVMPANIPHALKAKKRFKMLLTMVK